MHVRISAEIVWEYLSAIGAIADEEKVKGLLELGCKFERILLVPFDPYDFSIQKESLGADAAIENLANDSLTLAESEVGIGLETSQGVELATFRIMIRIPDESEAASE